MKTRCFLLLVAAFVFAPHLFAQSARNVPAVADGDSLRAERHWFDLRSRGIRCDQRSDDTAAFVAALCTFANSHVELPAGNCLIDPGPADGPAALTVPATQNSFRLAGGGGAYETTLVDRGRHAVSAPLLQIGDGTQMMNGTDVVDLSLTATEGVSYPRGIFSFWQNNLSTIRNVTCHGLQAAHSICLTNRVDGSYALFQEMRFDTLAVFGPSGPGSACVVLSSPGGNVNFIHSNLEKCGIGLKFTGTSGMPVLTWLGGRVERIPAGSNGGAAFWIDQAQPYIYGLDWEGGNIWLGSSVVSGDIVASFGAQGWPAFYSDNGIGNRFHSVGINRNKVGLVDLAGDEWYSAVGNVVPDPLFLDSGAAGWQATQATVEVLDLASPGARAGRSLLLTPTAPGGQIEHRFAIMPGTDYVLTAVFLLQSSRPSARLEVRDSNGRQLWDSGTLSGAIARPSGPDAVAYRVVRQLLSSGTARAFDVRVSSPDNTPVLLQALLLHRSLLSSGNVVAEGRASCVGEGGERRCTVAGGESGARKNALSWSVAAPGGNSAAFLRLHVATTADAVLPMCVLGSNNVYFSPNTSLDYVFALPSVPERIRCSDYFARGPSLTISQISLVAWRRDAR